ncbi:MAG: fructose-6-phosphate aldolase [Dehalococcoidia bacterium]|nr:fructose-6-phosphate aldolase [Dehalococcoidia bacterium]
MRIFLDTANVEEIRKAARLVRISGVTTNPTLIAKENRKDAKAVIQEISSIIDGPISAEVLSLESDTMIEEARRISSWASNVVVKVPISASGLEAISALAGEGIKCNATLCFSLNQAILAASAGAAFVSPFVGRLDDVGQDGMALVEEIVAIYDYYRLSTEVIAASIRHPLHVSAAAKAGAHVATIPFSVLMQMIKHPLTDAGITRFIEDWRRSQEA